MKYFGFLINTEECEVKKMRLLLYMLKEGDRLLQYVSLVFQ